MSSLISRLNSVRQQAALLAIEVDALFHEVPGVITRKKLGEVCDYLNHIDCELVAAIATMPVTSPHEVAVLAQMIRELAELMGQFSPEELVDDRAALKTAVETFSVAVEEGVRP